MFTFARYNFVLLTLLITSFHTQATPLPVAHTEYSAIRHIEMAEGNIVQTVHHSFGKERVESTMEGMSMVMITRPDKKLAWQIMPMNNMYMEVSTAQANEAPGKVPDNITIEKVGTEHVEGVETTKYKMLMKDKSAGGFLWLTKEHIPIKMDFLSKEGKEKSRIKMTLKQLDVDKQDQRLFELPSGFSKMPSMGGLIPR
ncbi:MAG TPA: DUF4412 domain-containing protein [Cellvibrio sp.]|nr:DUF4412 domain-containing protein [Cellvibrio sp.]